MHAIAAWLVNRSIWMDNRYRHRAMLRVAHQLADLALHRVTLLRQERDDALHAADDVSLLLEPYGATRNGHVQRDA